MSLFGAQRAELRAVYHEVWRRHRERLPLQPLEAQIVDVILAHPEYHALLESDAPPAGEPVPEPDRENPYLHLGLHLALREQVSTDRPPGIAAVHRRLVAASASVHAAEHRMIEVLATTLWQVGRTGRPADQAGYLARLRQL